MSNQISPHFTEDELNCRCGCGMTVKPELIAALEKLRARYGFPMKVTSGARCLTHNTAIGGEADSQHLLGLAVDVEVIESNRRFRLIADATALGWQGIGIAKKFVHLDIRKNATPVLWLYSE